jgi:hypothetical protein
MENYMRSWDYRRVISNCRCRVLVVGTCRTHPASSYTVSRGTFCLHLQGRRAGRVGRNGTEIERGVLVQGSELYGGGGGMTLSEASMQLQEMEREGRNLERVWVKGRKKHKRKEEIN